MKETLNCFELIFSTIDINEDKSVSKEELQIAHVALGNPLLAKDNDNLIAVAKGRFGSFPCLADY